MFTRVGAGPTDRPLPFPEAIRTSGISEASPGLDTDPGRKKR